MLLEIAIFVISGPKPSLLFGNFPNYLQRNFIYDLDDIYKCEFSQYRGCPFVGIYAVRKPKVFITDPEFSKKVLTTNFRNFRNNEECDMVDEKSDPIVALNPFWMRDDEWKRIRQEITPAFSNNRVKAQYPIMEATCHKMTNYLRRHVKSQGSNVKVEEISRRLTNENLMNCIFGLESHAFDEDKRSSLQMFKDYVFEFAGIDSFFAKIFIWPLFKDFYKYNLLKPRIKSFFVDMLKHGIAFRTKNPGSREDFLAFLMQMHEKKGTSVDGMVAHALTFILDGFETSGIMMDTVLYEMAKHPRVQEKLRKVIEEEITSSDGSLSYETLCDLPYLDQVVNETIRLHPPLLFLMKQCNESVEVPFNDGKETKIIPKGVSALISTYSLGRDPILYENPNDFYPERFDDGAVKDYKDKGVFLPFGDGPRICIGMRFALAQIKTAIVEIVRNFKFTLSSEMKEPLMLGRSFFGVTEQSIEVNFVPLTEE
uniref:Cytochrome n=1 Tax=Lutzomyia longipalpis TaxID=7200 RepID=A0A1B0GGQ8_LUTLO